ncbi:MAG: KamA family radical SAM protein [Firmicutes bacterium]|nr:KamA family radical SAM protein [Bacillota bacterium]
MADEKQYKGAVSTARQLCDAMGYPESEVERYDRIIEHFPMLITPYYLSLIDKNDPDDPIARMCIPSDAELSTTGSFDTSGEKLNTKQEGVQHKYAQTALILSTNVCATYCRYCFRKRLVGISEDELAKQAEDTVKYVKAHPEITNVLVSGGDPLMNPNRIIKSYLEGLSAVDTLDFIRFGSRVPVTCPQRIYDDKELLDMFAEYAKKKTLYLITQFNHPREITEESVKAVRCMQERGIQVRNQTVLLRGVNDDPKVLGELLRKFTRISVVPYYIFQCRPVTGVKERFQVPLLEGVKIVDAAKNMQNGPGKAVRYAMSHPLGKIEILGELSEGEMLFKFHQSKYPKNASRIFTVKLSPDTAWLDDDLTPLKK